MVTLSARTSAAFGVYVHVPFCLQKCHYCDFATLPHKGQVDTQKYTQILLKEIHTRAPFVPCETVSSVYFGGGTPSLLPREDFAQILQTLRQYFNFVPHAEVTVEINPGTLGEKDILCLLEHGVNRFSLGVQSFNDKFLKLCGRKHSARDSFLDIELFKHLGVNYSLDLLFNLPQQNLQHLKQDLNDIAQLSPPHVSAYDLSLPKKHFLQPTRPSHEEQVDMFLEVERSLTEANLEQYEVSNFARPGFESKHNQTYWDGSAFWGIGLSAHSYEPGSHLAPWGVRYWNPKKWRTWQNQVETNTFRKGQRVWQGLTCTQKEILKPHEAASDFCYTRLRCRKGLMWHELEQQIPGFELKVKARVSALLKEGLLENTIAGVRLSSKGRLLSNRVFEQLHFSN